MVPLDRSIIVYIVGASCTLLAIFQELEMAHA